MAEGSEPHLSGHAPTGGKQGSTHSLQSRQADSRQAGREAEEEAECGRHHWRVGADQGGVQQGQDVEELVLRLRPVALEDPQYLTLTPNVTLLQPGRTETDFSLATWGAMCAAETSKILTPSPPPLC